MRIVADESIPELDSTFGKHGTILRRKGREISATDLEQADILLIRSVTRIDQKLLADSPVRFIGSATIGIDHIDTEFLQGSGIHWCHAPGCNADAAAQYTLAMILLAVQRTGLSLGNLKAGIVGLGNVGARLHRMLQLLAVKELLACDPPLAAAGNAGLVGMEQITDCNLISFHVPLTDSGPCPTRHLGNRLFFDQLQNNTLVINSSRGKVLEESALALWLSDGKGYAALDVWPTEPCIQRNLLEAVTVATPHVAGYSLDGKLNGTRMLFRQFRQWKGLKPEALLSPYAPPPEPLFKADITSVADAVFASCPVQADDHHLRISLQEQDLISPDAFDSLRKNYPSRRDFAGKLLPAGLPESLFKTLTAMGFSSDAQ